MSRSNPSLDMKYDDPSADPRYNTPAPRVVGHFPPSPPEQELRIQQLKYLFYAYNLIVFVSTSIFSIKMPSQLQMQFKSHPQETSVQH